MYSTPSEMLAAYVRAFESLNAEAVVPFYSLPCTFIRPEGVWVVSEEASALALVRHLIDHAKAQRYHRTETSGLTVRSLAPTLAELSGVFIRHDELGSEVGRFGFTYIGRSDSGTWRIVVAVAHDAAAADVSPAR
ncbi:MAG: hypothetical protein U0529_03400 [Thermoanaerobaculia bacterium]